MLHLSDSMRCRPALYSAYPKIIYLISITTRPELAVWIQLLQAICCDRSNHSAQSQLEPFHSAIRKAGIQTSQCARHGASTTTYSLITAPTNQMLLPLLRAAALGARGATSHRNSLAQWQPSIASALQSLSTSAALQQQEEQQQQMKFDLLIVGAGPAGLSAAIRFKQVCLSGCTCDTCRTGMLVSFLHQTVLSLITLQLCTVHVAEQKANAAARFGGNPGEEVPIKTCGM